MLPRWIRALCFAVCLLPAAPALAHEAPLRVVSFNTGMGIGEKLRSRASLARLFAEGGELSEVDVLALQEICLNRRAELSLYLSAMQEAHGAQYHYADYASHHRGEPCEKGQALVTSYPIVAAGTLALPKVGAARSAIWVDLAVAGSGFDRLRVYNLHLSNRAKSNYVPLPQRAYQAEPVIEHALAFMHEFPGVPLIVAGDFNSLGGLTTPSEHEPVVLLFQRYFQATLPSYTSTFLLGYQPDWIFFANLSLTRSDAVRAYFSDHFPVVADFRL
jgi:endonuclease/exonuclease/phosphatase family metal-dependent hydrolase